MDLDGDNRRAQSQHHEERTNLFSGNELRALEAWRPRVICKMTEC